MKYLMVILGLCTTAYLSAQHADSDTIARYQKRLLDQTEVNILSSYYTQSGDNASVSGGRGSESLKNYPVNVVVSIPVGYNNILSIDAGVSAYTSASSSNLNPFDSNEPADPFVASSGASNADALASISVSYLHSSKDRNEQISLNASYANEYDYSSVGFGGGFTKFFNDKNSTIGITANVFLDNWNLLYPYELGASGGEDYRPFNINNYSITGNPDYNPSFTPYEESKRNSYALGINYSQVINKRLQGMLSVDIIQQDGQLANHMQRVYFSDVEATYIDNFRLADDVERLPGSRFKMAIGGRLHQYINEYFVARTFYRYYFDDWGIRSHTINLELPTKPIRWLTLTPSYRFYNQTAGDHFAPYAEHLSSNEFYTSDYDLSAFNAYQLGIGASYTDVFAGIGIGRWRFKSIDVHYYHYWRDTGLKADMVTAGLKFTIDKKNKPSKK